MTNAERCREYRAKRKKYLGKIKDPYLRRDPLHRGAYNRQVSQYSITGRFITSHPHVAGAARTVAQELGCPEKGKQFQRSIHACLRGLQDSAYGYRWAETAKDIWVKHAGVSGFWPGIKKALPRKRKRNITLLKYPTFLRNVLHALKILNDQQLEYCTITQFKKFLKNQYGLEVNRALAFLIRKRIVRRIWISYRYYRIFPVTGQWNYKRIECLLEEESSKPALKPDSTGLALH